MTHRSRATALVILAGVATALALAAGATCLTASRDLGRETLAPNDGWASFGAGTTGGALADAAHVYVVSNRAELIAALDYRSTVPRIIFVSGVIDANVDDNNQPLACPDYYRDGYTLEAYLATYDPAVWGRVPPTGPLENARLASRDAQQARVRIRVGSNTTIVGLDTRATIKGAWFDIRGTSSAPVTNIIVRNLRFVDTYDCFPEWSPTDGANGAWNALYDSISLRYADHVWVDHSEFADVETADASLPTYFGVLYQVHDGQLDITNASDLVTVSWNRFADHDKVMLIGSSDSSTSDRGKLRVTLHHNVFDNVVQRAPRVRFGQVHVYNNLYRIKGGADYGYSWGVGIESKIYAQENFFRVEEGLDPAAFISVLKGTAIFAEGTLVDAASANHLVDVVGAYNAANDPDLGSDVGWTPTLYLTIDPAFKLQALTSSGAGPFNW